MRRMFMFLIVSSILFVFPNVSSGAALDGVTCPKKAVLSETSLSDLEELKQALQEIVPHVYSSSPEYKEWEIEIMKPMPNLVGGDKAYYQMAVHFCGKEVADHSWFVRLRFPKLLPAQSASLGELYIVKNKDGKWSPWFRYH